jgi:predicted DNA-binding protein
MAARWTKTKRKRTGIFIYCSEDLKQRLHRVRRFTGRTLSGYVMHAVMPRLEADEAELARAEGPGR